jgi:E3 ubiquitin-protein ligase synoviolin
MTGTSNNTLTPTPTINPENHSQASSVDSSDTNAIHTPPSVTADQSNASAPFTTTQSTTKLGNAHGILVPEPEEDSSVLPNWGNSQLFPGPSRLANTYNTNLNSAPPPPVSGEGQRVSDTGLSADGSTPVPINEEEARRRAKGKAKAVTVEDAVGEAEGA